MSPSISASLAAQLAQQQTLAPQQQYALRLLRMNALELLAEADLAAEENPLLEREAPEADAPAESAPSLHEESDAVRSEDETPFPEDRGPLENIYSGWSGSGAEHADETPAVERVAAESSLRDDLIAELNSLNTDELTHELVISLIEELDDSGFLPQSLAETAESLKKIVSAPLEAWKKALALLQTFDPPGVGASSPAESLALQVRRRMESGSVDKETGELLIELILKHLREIAADDSKALLAVADGDSERLGSALALLKTLNPHPAANYASEATQYIIADISIRREVGRWQAFLNPGAQPGLRLSAVAQTIAVDESTPFGRYLSEARRLISGIEARQTTLLRAAEFATERQQAFFEKGRAALLPLTIGEAAAALGLSDSTVSRAISGKYFQCPLGTFELRSLFLLPAVQAVDAEGLSASVTPLRIRARISELIAQENPEKRLSDQALTDLLRAEGFDITRRTVAKYRDLEGIPTARLRRDKTSVLSE